MYASSANQCVELRNCEIPCITLTLWQLPAMAIVFFLFVFLPYRGGLHILHANMAEMQPLGLITGGHTATVRCINWDDEVIYIYIELLYNILLSALHEAKKQ